MQVGCHTRPVISFAAPHAVAQEQPGKNHKPDPSLRPGRTSG